MDNYIWYSTDIMWIDCDTISVYLLVFINNRIRELIIEVNNRNFSTKIQLSRENIIEKLEDG